MIDPKSISSEYLSNLGYRIQTVPPDEASVLLLEASTIILFAGFPEIAYQGFLKLIQGELKVSEKSMLAGPIIRIIPALCYLMKVPCPSIFSEQEMSFSELEKYINKYHLRENEALWVWSIYCWLYETVSCVYHWFSVVILSNNWSEEFLHDMTHPKVDIKGESRFKVYQFLQDLNRLLSRYYNQGKLQEASRWLEVFENVIDAWKLDVTYVEPEDIMVVVIRIYLGLKDTTNADRFIQRWWESLRSIMDGLYLLAYKPDIMSRISEGVLENKINISQEQAEDFLDLINRRNYIPANIGFIPTIDDWKSFLEKWNEAIFDNLDQKDIEYYESGYGYSNVWNRKSCLEIGATEEEVSELEKRLKTKLPLSYRNFLLTSNGFTILREDCELYDTKEIKWFIEEKRDWAESWDDDDDVTDEEYFQYGEHQDCCSMRGGYMKTALQISSTEDGFVYLLNPKIIDSRNEWEAWDFGSKYPGAFRYRSFWEMMQKVYKRSLSC